MDELSDHLREEFERMERERTPEEKAALYPYGRLIRDDVGAALMRSYAAPTPFSHLVAEGVARRQAERAARPWYRKVWDAVWGAVRAFLWTWRWRLTYAGRHLRGIDCECDC